ncbi:hypothetical protein Gotur_013551 [Gossypium turneri]
MAIFQSLQDENVEWKALWMIPDEILYRCRDFDWVLLLGIWGAVGFAPLLILRQYRSRTGEKDRIIGRGKDAARIRRRRPEVRSQENEKRK